MLSDDRILEIFRQHSEVLTNGRTEVLPVAFARAVEAAVRAELTPAATDVLSERMRQQSAEGWTPKHDDEHANAELARAGCCYLQQYIWRRWTADDLQRYRLLDAGRPPSGWPWAAEWWKPKDPRRDLVRATALILAEIERIDRAGKPAEGR